MRTSVMWMRLAVPPTVMDDGSRITHPRREAPDGSLLPRVLLSLVVGHDFADVDVTARVDPDRVRAIGELVGRRAMGAPHRQHLVVKRPDRDTLAALAEVETV